MDPIPKQAHPVRRITSYFFEILLNVNLPPFTFSATFRSSRYRNQNTEVHVSCYMARLSHNTPYDNPYSPVSTIQYSQLPVCKSDTRLQAHIMFTFYMFRLNVKSGMRCASYRKTQRHSFTDPLSICIGYTPYFCDVRLVASPSYRCLTI